MSASIDPPRAPLAPVARVLAEAALQRQNTLLGVDASGVPAAGGADGGTPVPGALPLPPTAQRPPLPAPADRVSISPQARQSLEGAATGPAGAASAARVAVPGPGGPATAAPAAGRSGAAPAPGAAAVQGLPWPASGVGAPLRQMLGALLQQLTAPTGRPQQVAVAQPWPAALAQGAADDLPPLQTWLARQGVVETADGPRGYALTLRVPAAWLLQQQPSVGAAGGSPAPAGAGPAVPGEASPPLVFAGRPQALQSGLFALVLQSGEGVAASRTSALLALDLAPHAQAAAVVYGRDMLALQRSDPWLQMAALQASGWRPEDDEAGRSGQGEACDTAGCPYAGRAPCVQPFCVALRVFEAGAARPAGDAPQGSGPPP
ncbi:Fe-S oxidoreductase [Acidovorax sp. SUPP2522]|uniref:hypothetical protein n=1 Tax=unclassified Acidovorax TaxID=2684926 RepID=UPI00234A452F|nr:MULTISPECIES: hypothetical protein [unclassified Acidovorax]WCM97639.1 hypothetical protein M5C96_25225 [Acidovorax sp. GBBC 1281]GKT13218.1 Fe-S oxidoreductase [Acidovorax sp. SUPP2522]